MNAAEMSLNVSMPLSSREFSVNYSGTLGRMDCRRLNQWLEVIEGIRIKSGVLEKGIDKKLITFLAKAVKIRETNMPDGSDPAKTGEVKYSRKSDDAFIQVMWFALRNGLGDIVGF